MLININNGQLKIGAREGQSLRDALASNEIKLGVCGGRGVCGKCKVKVCGDVDKVTPAEQKKLTADEIAAGYRLACQMPARDGLNVEIDSGAFLQPKFKAVCTAITPLTADIRMFRFDMPDGGKIDYIPGQYIQLTTPASMDSYPCVTRTFSISSDPADKSYFELIIRRTPCGDCTKFLFEKLKIGQTLEFMGPDGDFKLSQSDAPMIMIAGGSGMSAIRCLLYEMKRIGSRRKAIYFFGAPAPEGLYMLDEMKAFQTSLADFKFVPCVQNAPDSFEGAEKGLVTEAASRHIANMPQAEGYLCGAPAMIEAAVKVLKNAGISEDRIFYDSFG